MRKATMAEVLYPYSREEARREGGLDRWKEGRRAAGQPRPRGMEAG